jgi:hypothetical protein
VRREKRVRIAFARLKIKQKDSSARTATSSAQISNISVFQYLAFWLQQLSPDAACGGHPCR